MQSRRCDIYSDTRATVTEFKLVGVNSDSNMAALGIFTGESCTLFLAWPPSIGAIRYFTRIIQYWSHSVDARIIGTASCNASLAVVVATAGHHRPVRVERNETFDSAAILFSAVMLGCLYLLFCCRQ